MDYSIDYDDSIRNRCKCMTSELGIPISKFCERIGISRSAYDRWQRHNLQLTEQRLRDISEYLSHYGF